MQGRCRGDVGHLGELDEHGDAPVGVLEQPLPIYRDVHALDVMRLQHDVLPEGARRLAGRYIWRRCAEDMARYGEVWRDMAGCAGMWGGVGRYVRARHPARGRGVVLEHLAGDVGRIWRDMARHGEIWRDVARYGEMCSSISPRNPPLTLTPTPNPYAHPHPTWRSKACDSSISRRFTWLGLGLGLG